MGTNYYARHNICDHCDRHDEVHIGKSSFGWRFTFRSYRNEWDDPGLPRTVDDWRAFLEKPGVRVFDEYQKPIELAEFWSLVAAKRDGHSHDEYGGFRDGVADMTTRDFS